MFALGFRYHRADPGLVTGRTSWSHCRLDSPSSGQQVCPFSCRSLTRVCRRWPIWVYIGRCSLILGLARPELVLFTLYPILAHSAVVELSTGRTAPGVSGTKLNAHPPYGRTGMNQNILTYQYKGHCPVLVERPF